MTVLRAIERIIKAAAATVAWVFLYGLSTCFVLLVLVLATLQPRRPVRL